VVRFHCQRVVALAQAERTEGQMGKEHLAAGCGR
jgi:hypothetical protein